MSHFKLPSKKQLNAALASFSKTEWIIFNSLIVVLIISTLFILEDINKKMMVTIPVHGGNISEGVVGVPRFINPVLASSEADQDLVSLVYSGLMRKNTDGTLIPDLASTYTMSTDGLTYTFTLKNNLSFQDGKPLTVDDIVFTINEAKDGVIKSPHKAEWDNVTVTKIDNTTIQFSLKQPSASFLQSTTLGIMPATLWNNSPIELNSANTNPIGSGPYMVKSVSKESSGIIDSYELVPFKKFALGEPYISKFTLHFYTNENDLINGLQSGQVNDISSIAPEDAAMLKEKGYQVESAVLPRVFGLFFNQSQNQIFIDKTVVSAIDETIDKDQIISQVLSSYGVPIDGPIPPNFTQYSQLTAADQLSRDQIATQVQASLAKDGWVKGADGFLAKTTTVKKKSTTIELAFSISTGNAPELAKTAELIQQDLLAIGMKVDVKTFDTGDLNQTVIRPRKYDALFFGEIINNKSDLFAFWHSSQRKDPGLNIALYTNVKVDKILEDAAVTVDATARTQKYIQFEDAIEKDMPAVFIYSPDLIYVVSKNLKGAEVHDTIIPADRYANVYAWYTSTENVWKIFAK